jgi:glycosyltransferase involved in cell wall biosynthesis
MRSSQTRYLAKQKSLLITQSYLKITCPNNNLLVYSVTMKIVHVTQFLGIGGLEKIIYHIIPEQMSLGHEVSLYVYDYDREWVPFFISSGINVITPPTKKPGYDFSVLKRMNKDLFNADVIHTHDLNPLLYLFPRFFLIMLTFMKRPRLIHTTHGLDHINRTPRYKSFEKIIIPFTDKVVGVSEKIGKFYRDELFINPKKVRVIENGVATYKGQITPGLRKEKKQWLCDKHGLDVTRPVFLSLSRVIPLKDQLFLMNAFKERPDYQLIVVGPPSDPAYYESLKKHVDKNIILAGPQDQVSDYNLGSDVYVSASTHEGIPVAVLEAMAVETPCIVSNIPGHKTLSQFGICVEFFELKDQEKFLNLCDKLLTDKELAYNNSKLAKKIVEDHYSVTKMVSQYLGEYQA